MIDTAQIRQVSDEIARLFQPERIILFGSYAYGTPTELFGLTPGFTMD